MRALAIVPLPSTQSHFCGVVRRFCGLFLEGHREGRTAARTPKGNKAALATAHYVVREWRVGGQRIRCRWRQQTPPAHIVPPERRKLLQPAPAHCARQTSSLNSHAPAQCAAVRTIHLCARRKKRKPVLFFCRSTILSLELGWSAPIHAPTASPLSRSYALLHLGFQPRTPVLSHASLLRETRLVHPHNAQRADPIPFTAKPPHVSIFNVAPQLSSGRTTLPSSRHQHPMGDAGFFKGTSADQDTRFSDKHKKLLRSMHFPPEFSQKIDMKKVNLKVIKGWMAQRVSQLLGIEDEVVVEYAFGMLEESSPDPKTMQINLQGFLDKNSQPFVLELWKLLISAQTSLGGIPQQFLDQTKEELLQAKRAKEAELAKIREQEAKERAIAEEVRQKAQAIRNATRPSASSLGNGESTNGRSTLQERPREDRDRHNRDRDGDFDRKRERHGRSRSRDGHDSRSYEPRRYDADSRRHDRRREHSRDVDRRDHRQLDRYSRSSRHRSRSRSRSRGGRNRDYSRDRSSRSHREYVGKDRKRERERERDRGHGRDDERRDDLSATKRRRVRSTSRSRSRSRSASGNRAIKIESTGTRSRTPPPSSPSRTPSAAAAIEGRERSASSSRAIKPEDDTEDKTGKTGTTKSTTAAAVDTVALENELRERLLRERVLQSVKSKQSSQESPSEK